MVLYSTGAPGLATLKESKFNANVTLNTDIFDSDLEPIYSPTTFRIYVAFIASNLLTLMRTKGGTTMPEHLNGGVALAANAAYIFDIIVEAEESINFQYGATTTCRSLKVVEVPGMVS